MLHMEEKVFLITKKYSFGIPDKPQFFLETSKALL